MWALDDLNGYMQEALRLAEQSLQNGEVPVGAVVIAPDGVIIGRGANCAEAQVSQLCHAELCALRDAVAATGDWRLEGCLVVVTLEPCLMCLGALLLSRVSYIVYGARSPLFGATGLVGQLSEAYRTHTIIRGGLQEEECGGIMTRFFSQSRTIKKDVP